MLFLLFFSVATPSLAQRTQVPRGWTKLGKVQGLLGDEWYSRKTKHCLVYATKIDLNYVSPVVDGLDESYSVNAEFMGFRARGPLEFYYFPQIDPAHTHPKFKRRVGNASKFAGLALSGTKTCLVNLGSQQQARPFRPWEVESTSRHEMNHLFAFQKIRQRGWSWFLEAIAENIEQTVLPRNARLDTAGYRKYLKGYKSEDASWAALTAERNNNNVNSYRQFGDILSSIISFLRTKYGKNAVAKVMRAAPGKTVDQALQAAFFKNSAQLEAEWKKFYEIR